MINNKLSVTPALLWLMMSVSFLLSACDGNSQLEENIANEILIIGVAVVVYPGDTLIKDEDNTVVKITHELDNDVKKVELISGSAHLVRGSYAIN
jgi:hypothetical protein